jgi:hypothetical protein
VKKGPDLLIAALQKESNYNKVPLEFFNKRALSPIELLTDLYLLTAVFSPDNNRQLSLITGFLWLNI